MWVLDPGNSADLIDALRPHARDAEFDVCWVGEGWRDIVLECHRAIVTEFPNYELLTVKQKFGVLEYQALPRRWVRNQPQWTPDEARALDAFTDVARLESETVCEWCGAEAELRDERAVWLTPLQFVRCPLPRPAIQARWPSSAERGLMSRSPTLAQSARRTR